MVHTHNLPATPEPEGTICVPLFIPDEPTYVALLVRAIRVLTLDRHYDRDEAHTAITVRRVWQETTLTPLIDALASGDCMTITCEQVAECIETSETVAEALRRVEIRNTVNNTALSQITYQGDQIARDVALAPAQKTEPVAPPPPACDQDALWAGIRYAVERLDEEGRDFLDDLIQIQDVLERLASLPTLIPAIGAVIDQYTEFVSQWLPDIKNAYEAYSDPDNLDVFACGLFQLVCDECRYPSWDELLDYLLPSAPELQAAGGKAITMTDLAAALTDIARVATVNPSAMWHATIIFTTMMIEINSWQRSGFGRRSFAVWASLGEDNPTDNWEVLCGGCGVPAIPDRVNFYPSEGEYTITQGAQYENGVEVRPTDGSNPLRAIVTVDWSNDNPDNFARVRWSGLSNGSGDSTTITVYDKQGNLLDTRVAYPARYITFTFGENFSAPIGRVEFTLRMNSNQAGSRLYYAEIF